MRGIEYYRQKYSLGLVDISNSLEKYDSFLSNLGEEKTLEEMIGKLLQFKRKMRILDIGCGNAGALKELKKKFGKRIETIGMDLVPFPTLNADHGIIGNALEKKLPNNCDLVFSFRTLHEIGSSEVMVKEICRILAPEGTALLAFRLRTFSNGVLEWIGEMEEADEYFLFRIAEDGKLGNCTVFGRIVFENLSDSTKTPTGIFLKIKKEA
jgi:ubiquinone/menaquinone biosynthesis C-methylase UbiE